MYLPHDRVGVGRSQRTYKYALNVVDVASRYKEAEPLTDKSATEVSAALCRTYKHGPVTWPRLLQVDPGREFMGAVNQLLVKHNVSVRRGRVDTHRDQDIVERFNRTLAQRLFGAQYAQELLVAARGSSERSSEWMRALPDVVAEQNDEVTRLTQKVSYKKPSEAIRASAVAHKPSLPARRVVGLEEPLLPFSALLRYIYAPSELEGGCRRATDPVWSLMIHTIRNVVRQSGQTALYYLNEGPARGFVREELLIVPRGSELPPDRVLIHRSKSSLR